MMELLVVEWIVYFGDIDLLSWLLDPRHLVGHPCSLLNIFWIGQISVRPVRRVKGPAYTVQPDRLVCQFLCNFLGSKDDRGSTVARRTHVQPFHRRTNRLGVHDILNSNLSAQLSTRMIHRVSLVLHRNARDLLLLDSILVHVPPHLQRENPQQRRAKRSLQDLIEDAPER